MKNLLKQLKELKDSWDDFRWLKFQERHKSSLDEQLENYQNELEKIEESFSFELEEYKYRVLSLGAEDKEMYHRKWCEYVVQLQSLRIETLKLKINHVKYLLKNEPIIRTLK